MLEAAAETPTGDCLMCWAMSDLEPQQPAEMASEEELLELEAGRFGDQLRDEEVGGRVVRGGITRTIGYGISAVAIGISSIFVLRYLGVSDFGRYATVVSLVAIVAGITDSGLTTVGNRELALTESSEERRAVLARILGLRLVLTPIGVVLALAFALLAGYDKELVIGTLLGGIAATAMAISGSLSLPLAIDLKITGLTILDLIRQATPTLIALVLIVASASLVPFFLLPLPGALLAMALTPYFAGRGALAGPSFNLREWGELLKRALPVAVATTFAVLYIRVLTILMFELSSDFETGLFGTSVRIVELVIGVPWIVFAVALPVLSVANSEDRERTSYVFQRMLDVGLLFSTGLAVALYFFAEPAIEILGGSDYAGAVPVLQIQCFTLVAAFVAQAAMYAAVAMQLTRQLIWVNVFGFVAILVFGYVLIESGDAKGAAAAALVADALTAIAYLIAVARSSGGLDFTLLSAWKPVLAGVISFGAAYALDVSPVIQTAVALGVFTAIALATRAVPPEVFDAIRRKI